MKGTSTLRQKGKVKVTTTSWQ